MNRRGARAIALSLALACLAPGTRAEAQQGVFAGITGTVRDSSGAVLPGASLTVTNLATNATKTWTTNEAGVYRATDLIPGPHKMEASLPGFKTAVVESVLLDVNASLRIDLTLEVGGAEELVIVVAPAPLLQSERTNLGQTVTEQQIELLPIGRALFSLIPLAAGVSQQLACDADCGNNANLRINGDRPRTQDYILDGTTINQPVFGGQSINPSIDVIQAFRIESNSMSAEYGRAGGGLLIAVTKSGTNQLHGSAYEYHRNEKLNARDFFEDRAQPKIPFDRNEFGGTLGGPLVNERLFYFMGYQRVRADTSAPVVGVVVPNEAFRIGDLSVLCTAGFDAAGTCGDPSQQIRFPATGTAVPFNRIPAGRVSPISRAFMALMPTSGSPGPNPGTLELADRSAEDSTLNQMDTRVDYHVTSSDQVVGALHANWGAGATRRTNPIPNGRTSHVGDYAFSAGWTRIFTSSTLNNLRVGYMHRKNHFLPEGSPADFGIQGIPECLSAVPGLSGCGNPSVAITGFSGVGGGLPFYEPASTLHLSDTFTRLLGRHSVKLGGEARRVAIDNYQPNSPQGSFSFRGTESGHPFADFLFGVMNTGSVNLQNAMVQTRAWSYSLFVQDDFKIRPTVTLNLGLRWQYDQSVREKNNALAFFNPYTAAWEQFGVNAPETPFDPSKKQFAPRVGIAWSATPTLVIRGGYGITYPGWVGHGRAGDGEVSPNVLANTTFARGTDWGNLPPIRNPDPSAIGAPLPVAGTVSFVYWAPREQAPPQFQLWNFTIEKQLGPNTAAQVGYVGSAGRHLPINYGYNICAQTPETAAQFGSAAPTSPHCPLAAEKVLAGGGSLYDLVVNPGFWGLSRSNYHSLQGTFERRFSGGMSLLANFTWSRLMDDSSADWSGFWSLDVLGQDFYNRDADYTVSSGDIPLRLTVAPIVELPFGPGRRWLNSGVASQLLGGWRAAAVYNVSSGSPFGIMDKSYGYCNAAHTLSNRPNMIGDPLPAGFDQTLDHWFDTRAFDFSGTCPAQNLVVTSFPGDPAKAFGNAPRYFSNIRNPGVNNVDLSLQKDFGPGVGDQRRLRFRADFFNLFNHPQFGEAVSDPTDANFGRILRTSVNNRTVQLGLHAYF